ncbi:MAG: TIGR03960 family B12-binding radical SAM protein [Cyanobacteria bacterium NC_groundwater_1444_Ag_S-0.65um_54_12]|nr:TIGR03960 family B12-binding radical SAM protein [Cyanobacteria bacterium NC_groundwater_1444_Ag_S-0.65um_54_12]
MSSSASYLHDLQNLLFTVEKPARYLGSEWGASGKAWADYPLRIALAFPDRYEVGMSHLGSRILYQILNRLTYVFCDRVFAPAPDMASKLRNANIPLYGLESKQPLAAFAAIGFTFSYELNYTNFLDMLDLAGIPQERCQREAGSWPFIFVGGPNSFNPEPFADFVDFVVIGDGEEVMQDLAKALHAFKDNPELERREQLLTLAQIPGIYVPQFYRVEYEGPNRPVKHFTPDPGVPFPVVKRVLPELLPDYHPDQTPVPYLPIIHDRAPIEVRRGCDAGCRYCQAGFIYLPVRERKASDVAELANQTISGTGYEEYSLFSLSSGDYTQSVEAVRLLIEQDHMLGANLSLPSLRVDSFSLEMAMAAQQLRKSTFTFAPEAGTQRLRDVINKNLTAEEIRYVIRETYRAGWHSVKLYFMIGLPSETTADIAGIVELVDQIRQDALLTRQQDPKPRPAIRIHLTISTFVPKPHVPFQWRPQDTLPQIAEKQAFLRKEMQKRGMKISFHDRHASQLEAVLARGDRRLGRLLKRAWQLGAVNDAWSEHFKPELWAKAAQDTGIDFNFYAHTHWNYDWALPWDIVAAGVNKRYLRHDDERAASGKQLEHCSKKCWGCGVCPNLGVAHSLAGTALPKIDCSAPPRQPSWQFASNPSLHERVQRLRLRFSKDGDLRFISHLDLLRLFERALRRAALPVAFSRGFNPRPAIEFAAPLALGSASKCELADIYPSCRVDATLFSERLSAALPPEIAISAAWEVPQSGPSLMSLVEEASYRIKLRDEIPPVAWHEFLARPELLFIRKRKTGEQQINLRPLIRAILPENEKLVNLRLQTGSQGNARPDVVLAAMGAFLARTLLCDEICRTELVLRDS